MFNDLDKSQQHHRRHFHLLAVAFAALEQARQAEDEGDLERAMDLLDDGLVESTAMLPLFLNRLHYRTIRNLFRVYPTANKHLAGAALLQAKARIRGKLGHKRQAVKESRLAYDLYQLIDTDCLDPRYLDRFAELFPAVHTDLNAAAARS